MRQCLNVLVVLGVLLGVLAGAGPTPVLAGDNVQAAPSSLAMIPASGPDSLLTPTSMADPSAGLDSVLPPASNVSQFLPWPCWWWWPWCRCPWPWWPWCGWWPWPWWPWWWWF